MAFCKGDGLCEVCGFFGGKRYVEMDAGGAHKQQERRSLSQGVINSGGHKGCDSFYDHPLSRLKARSLSPELFLI
jgi:hypothetical protein